MERLTHREQEVSDLLITGLSNKEIGRTLSISHRTVEDYRHNIFTKREVHNATALVHQILTARIAKLELEALERC